MKSEGVKSEGVKSEGVKSEGVKNEGVKSEGVKSEGVKSEGVKNEGVMRSFVIFVASVLMLSITAYAQPEVGTFSIKPKAGVNIAYFGESQSVSGGTTKTSPRIGLAAGLEFEYQIKERLSLSAGAIYSQQGEKGEIGSIFNMTAKTDYINFPVLANMYLAKGFALKLGIQPGINVRAGYSLGNFTGSLSDVGINIKKFDLCIPFGLSYEYESFVIDARYNLGVLNIVDSPDKTWNRGVQITVGLKFNLK